jgi:hypothetical protein
MSKKVILGLALALVLVSGAFAGARADCGCLPSISIPSPCNWFSFSNCRDRDLGPYNPFPGAVHSIGVAGCCETMQ